MERGHRGHMYTDEEIHKIAREKMKALKASIGETAADSTYVPFEEDNNGKPYYPDRSKKDSEAIRRANPESKLFKSITEPYAGEEE